MELKHYTAEVAVSEFFRLCKLMGIYGWQ